MPTKKISDLQDRCTSRGHNPPTNQVFRPGIYEHTCPACGKRTVFTVRGPVW